MAEDTVRINKFLSQSGYCSRREADSLITQDRVLINGKKASMGQQVGPQDLVLVDGEVLSQKPQKKKLYLAFHKPVGIVCTTDTRVEKDNIIDFINYPQRIFPIGRLDKMSEGLILLTNIGDLVNAVLRKRFGHEKEYIVWLNNPITSDKVRLLRQGIEIGDGKTLPCKIKQLAPNQLVITLTEGRNRQIRRMIEAVELKVARLKRVRFMHLKLEKLPKGKWRELSKHELDDLFAAAKLS